MNVICCSCDEVVIGALRVKETYCNFFYCISLVIRLDFFPFQNHLKDLDPSCKMDLDLQDCFGRETPFYS